MSFLIASLLLLGASTTNPACTIAHVERCRDTNELVWDKDFQRAVHRFLGRARGRYVSASENVADQVVDVLGGPPDEPRRLGKGWLFTACFPHECEEKGAAVIEPAGRIALLGILHDGCAQPRAPLHCGEVQVLTLFVGDKESEAAYAPAVTKWARAAVAADSLPNHPERLTKIETILVKPLSR